MVKLNDEMILQVGAIGAGGLGLGLLAAPDTFNKIMVPPEHKGSRPFTQHAGVLSVTISLMSAMSAKADNDTRKKALKVTGAAWLATGALDVINARNGTQTKNGVAGGLGEIALGTISLVAGFQK